jgi:hypothetical protein
MFLYRVKIEELDASRMLTLKNDLTRSEESFRAYCPIREMSVVTEGRDMRELDIYLALDDFIDSEQLRRLAGDLDALIDVNHTHASRVSSELIHI